MGGMGGNRQMTTGWERQPQATNTGPIGGGMQTVPQGPSAQGGIPLMAQMGQAGNPWVTSLMQMLAQQRGGTPGTGLDARGVQSSIGGSLAAPVFDPRYAEPMGQSGTAPAMTTPEQVRQFQATMPNLGGPAMGGSGAAPAMTTPDQVRQFQAGLSGPPTPTPGVAPLTQQQRQMQSFWGRPYGS